MTNKYLVKIAGVNAEEVISAHVNHDIATHNLYGKHFNLAIKEINKRHSGPEFNGKAYVDDIMKTMRSHSELRKEYEPLHAKFKSKMESIGGSANPQYLDGFLDNKESEYRQDFK